ncbi:MAG: thiamine ABC transporter substrate-binding protein [Acidimicrobiia bacterium]|nr:thiamine ABC transporter substrate-binding protein [Acidimicrobiia bacterium]
MSVFVVAAACSTDPNGPQTIRLVTHDSFLISDGVLEAFETASGHRVERLTGGDAGTMVNQAVLTKGNPIGDVMFGVDTTFLGRALDEGLFEPYESSGLDAVPDALEVSDLVTPIDFGDVCLNYDIAGLAESGIAPPSQLADLTEPPYSGRLVVENPATSSPGLAFLLATVAAFGEEGAYTWQEFWTDLVGNDVIVTSGWEEAYYGEFSGGAGSGSIPIVVSYASSPPAEIIFADPRPAEAPTAVVTSGCFRQVEFAGILAGTEVAPAAGELIDFMLSLEFQEDIPLNMFVFPANQDAALPPEFIEFTQVPEQPLTLDPRVINENRDRWIDEWTQIVLP